MSSLTEGIRPHSGLLTRRHEVGEEAEEASECRGDKSYTPQTIRLASEA